MSQDKKWTEARDAAVIKFASEPRHRTPRQWYEDGAEFGRQYERDELTAALRDMAGALEKAKEFTLSVNQTSVVGSEKYLWSEEHLPMFIDTLTKHADLIKKVKV